MQVCIKPEEPITSASKAKPEIPNLSGKASPQTDKVDGAQFSRVTRHKAKTTSINVNLRPKS
jgi:hypothetical protein